MADTVFYSLECPHCGSHELDKNGKIYTCKFCGAQMVMDTKKVQDENIYVPKIIRDPNDFRMLSNEFVRLKDFFKSKKETYERVYDIYGRLIPIEEHKEIGRGYKVWGCILPIIGILCLIGLMPTKAASPGQAAFFIIMGIFLFLTFVSIGVWLWIIKNQKEKTKVKTIMELYDEGKRLSVELKEYYNTYNNGFCPIGMEYTSMPIIEGLCNIAKSGRVSTTQEALNIFLTNEFIKSDKYRYCLYREVAMIRTNDGRCVSFGLTSENKKAMTESGLYVYQ